MTTQEEMQRRRDIFNFAGEIALHMGTPTQKDGRNGRYNYHIKPLEIRASFGESQNLESATVWYQTMEVMNAVVRSGKFICSEYNESSEWQNYLRQEIETLRSTRKKKK